MPDQSNIIADTLSGANKATTDCTYRNYAATEQETKMKSDDTLSACNKKKNYLHRFYKDYSIVMLLYIPHTLKKNILTFL